jgi:acylphosphatase
LVKHFNITVKGKVQGVFFRVYTQKKAQELSLSGTVENRSNGDVYIEAEGEEQKLKELADWCKTGSPNSEVDEVIIEEKEVKNFTGDFGINR